MRSTVHGAYLRLDGRRSRSIICTSIRGGVDALRDLSFAIEPGTVTGLLGPSGSGQVDAAARRRRGADRRGRTDRRCSASRRARPTLRDARRVRDPGAVGLRRPDRAREPLVLRPHPRRARGRRSSRRSRRVGLGDAAARPVRTFSGGQLSRVSLATRSSATRSCSSSTSRPSGSIPCCVVTCGTTFRRLAGDGHDAARLVARHGRGRTLRPPAAPSRGQAARRRDAAAELRARTGCDEPRRRVPRAGRGAA